MPEERIRFMMRKLLLQSDYLKIDQLAEELFISRMTVSSDLKRTGAVSPLRYDPCLKAWIWLKSRRRRIAKGRATQTYCLKNPPYLI